MNDAPAADAPLVFDKETDSVSVTRDLTLPEALRFAIELHRSGQLEPAEQIYGRILDAYPDHFDALHYLGILRHHIGQSEEGLALLRRALELQPGAPNLHSNLGKLLSELGRTPEAAEAYSAALALQPTHREALCNLGVLTEARGRLDEAEALYRRAYAADPLHLTPRTRLVDLLCRTERIKEGARIDVEWLKAHSPASPRTYFPLAMTYLMLDETENALSAVSELLVHFPDDVQALHLKAALTGENVPERASDAFVSNVFDSFAATFDERLASLNYRAPQLVSAAVTDALGEPAKSLEILDAGCGTGLCGPFLEPFACRLTGVDLSEKMLEKAAQRACYDELRHAELTQYLTGHPSAFQVIVSADTLCYFGALTGFSDAAFGALKGGGLLSFTVEEDAGAREYRLAPHGRFVHRRDYVESTLFGSGFERIELEPVVLRMEAMKPVSGLVVTAWRPS